MANFEERSGDINPRTPSYNTYGHSSKDDTAAEHLQIHPAGRKELAVTATAADNAELRLNEEGVYQSTGNGYDGYKEKGPSYKGGKGKGPSYKGGKGKHGPHELELTGKGYGGYAGKGPGYKGGKGKHGPHDLVH
ncbi:hypothetical protein KP509_37G028100 [Ceratopteris richardii]|uniref:Uncharacterized protein n=1 Tax=Ceratopteris richardii TaxID=49495 RepID=A0A8T2Q7N5_CERRI|nr:hypothetical protein KP509_37G028100 [Ceratopteris richardii]